MNVLTAFYSVVTGLGLAISLYTGYLVVRGPFLDGSPPGQTTLMLALGGFIVGIVVLFWGATKAVGVGARI